MNSEQLENLYNLQQASDSEYLDIEQVKKELVAKGNEPLTARDWNMILASFLPNELLVSKHRKIIDEGESDSVRLKAIELAYKLKGKLTEPERESVTIKLDFLPSEGE